MPECGESGMLTDRLETDISHHVNGITNVMKYFGMIEGQLKINGKQKYVEKRFTIRSNYGGLFYPKVKPGENISKNQVLGSVMNIQGEFLGEVTAPCDGVLRGYDTWHDAKPR